MSRTLFSGRDTDNCLLHGLCDDSRSIVFPIPMKHLILLLLLALSIGCAASAKEPADAPTPVQMVEVRGELVPMYESLKGIGDPRTVKPKFPRDADGRRVSGKALIGVLINEKGVPLEVEVVQSEPIPACGENAATAVKKWRFPRHTREGKPTKYIVRVPVFFHDRT